MKSIVFFVATIATVLAVPSYYHHAPALQVYSNGAVVPVEPHDVQAEKAKHFAAHAERASGAHVVGVYAAPHAHWGHHVPVIHNGVPVDTPEVQHAKAAHFAAVAKAGGHAYDHGHHHYAAGHYHVPVIHNGVPVDTPEVQHAKAAHFAAVAKAGGHAYDHGHWAGHDHGHWHGHHEDDGSYKPDIHGY